MAAGESTRSTKADGPSDPWPGPSDPGHALFARLESERASIAHRLHDGPAQSLTACLLVLDDDGELDPDTRHALLDELRSALAELRILSQRLKPLAADCRDPLPALLAWLHAGHSQGILHRIEPGHLPALDIAEPTARLIYRLAQESILAVIALTNDRNTGALPHVSLHASTDDRQVRITLDLAGEFDSASNDGQHPCLATLSAMADLLIAQGGRADIEIAGNHLRIQIEPTPSQPPGNDHADDESTACASHARPAHGHRRNTT